MPAKREFCYIDTIDSDKHYSVVGLAEDVVERLEEPSAHRGGRFVQFRIADRDGRSVYIDPDKVIAVLEPVR